MYIQKAILKIHKQNGSNKINHWLLERASVELYHSSIYSISSRKNLKPYSNRKWLFCSPNIMLYIKMFCAQKVKKTWRKKEIKNKDQFRDKAFDRKP